MNNNTVIILVVVAVAVIGLVIFMNSKQQQQPVIIQQGTPAEANLWSAIGSLGWLGGLFNGGDSSGSTVNQTGSTTTLPSGNRMSTPSALDMAQAKMDFSEQLINETNESPFVVFNN